MDRGSSLLTAVGKLGIRVDQDQEWLGPIAMDADVAGVERLRSRKNRVYRIITKQGSLVAKIFETGKSEYETDILLRAFEKGVVVPEVYGAFANAIVMEYVEGATVCDALNNTLDPGIAVDLAAWFSAFHSAFRIDCGTLVRCDCNLRNFIVAEGGTCGVDFEQAQPGDALEDLGEVCSHILDTDPMFTPRKYHLCEVFLDEYRATTGADLSRIKRFVAKSLEKTAGHRPSQRRTLLDKARELKENERSYPFDKYK